MMFWIILRFTFLVPIRHVYLLCNPYTPLLFVLFKHAFWKKNYPNYPQKQKIRDILHFKSSQLYANFVLCTNITFIDFK